jgi:hypothetical protein
VLFMDMVCNMKGLCRCCRAVVSECVRLTAADGVFLLDLCGVCECA